ncbi:ergothioneine biosynthesis protein EgtB [Granulicella sp. WH15]|uniref:ergothioneine biosynthesis protein EgtB n=1 Tax=Granulicella sp. WH15 TaxID=2602070 RepID=UPI001367548D|nr:ergothioneine biosynthesis protein EgtB [Granulicella sp. WH15]QHN04489.1 ergothioneine biosynthesis protein EgtB [Granulicella sp. WH15]
MPTQVQNPAVATALLERFRTVRAATLAFASPLSPEDLMVQSLPEASPVKWHLAHTSWFFETFVLTDPAIGLPGYQPFHPDFRWLFNSYYNALGEMPEKKLRSSFSRPPLTDILAFRAHIDSAIERLLEGNAEAEALRRITLGLEHEQQHLELIATDIKHALFTNPLHPAYLEAPATPGNIAPPVEFIPFAGGLTRIGTIPDATDPLSFAFDNETPEHTVFLQPYRLASRLVTVAEYLAFMDDNAYSRPELWLSEGWATMRAAGWQAPLYWQRDPATSTGWSIYTLGGLHPLETLAATPVCHLSFFEADAFARWSGCRLPTEFEWEHAAATLSTTQGNFLESNALHPLPAPTTNGLHQLFGDTWEWTASPYTGYPGYKPLPGALGEYNGKFMSSQIILRGGSSVTPTTHIRATYRNFFPPSTRWQFSGLRLAQDA